MPRLFPPSLLENPKARSFCLQKQITDIHSLRRHLRGSVCLAIDVEGCEGIGEGITSIGLAVLPPTDFLSTSFPSAPFETRELVRRYQIESYCLYTKGRSRQKPQPPFPFGITIRTTDPGGETKVIVDGIRQRHAGKDIVLVGWHPHPRELPAIQAIIPSLFDDVIGWADVVDVARQLCVSKQEDLAKSWPPLSDVMLSVGFRENCLPQRFCHGAGSDAIHAIVVFARLLTHNSEEPTIEIRRRRPLKHWQQDHQGEANRSPHTYDRSGTSDPGPRRLPDCTVREGAGKLA
jgi:hypothetical protein